MNHVNQQLEIAQDHIEALRLEASQNRELQSLGSTLSLRCHLAYVLRNWAANLEPESVKASRAR